MKKDVSTVFPAAIINPANQSTTTATSISAHWLYTLRGRFGYAWNNWMLYGTGGLAVTRINLATSYTNMALPARVVFESEAASKSETKVGWTVGAGAEYAISQKWTAKLEYLFAILARYQRQVRFWLVGHLAG